MQKNKNYHRSGLFKDMTGLEGGQKLAQATLEQTVEMQKQYAGAAERIAGYAQAQHYNNNANRIMDNIRKSGLPKNEQDDLVRKFLGNMVPGGSDKKDVAVVPTAQNNINAAGKLPAGSEFTQNANGTFSAKIGASGKTPPPTPPERWLHAGPGLALKANTLYDLERAEYEQDLKDWKAVNGLVEDAPADYNELPQIVQSTYPFSTVQNNGTMQFTFFINNVTGANGVNISNLTQAQQTTLVNYIQTNILQVWNGQTIVLSDANSTILTTNITIVTNVNGITPAPNALSPGEFIFLIGNRNVRSNADVNNKTAYIDWQDVPNINNANPESVAAHEFGHLLGLDDRYHYYQREVSNQVLPLIRMPNNVNVWQNTFDTVPAILPNNYDDAYIWNTNLFANPVSPLYTSVTNLQLLIFLGNYQNLQNNIPIIGENIPIGQYTFFGNAFKTQAGGVANTDFINSIYFNPLGLVRTVGDLYYVVLKTEKIEPMPNISAASYGISTINIGTYDPSLPVFIGFTNILPLSNVIFPDRSKPVFGGIYRPLRGNNPAESWGRNRAEDGRSYGHNLWISQAQGVLRNQVIMSNPYAIGG